MTLADNYFEGNGGDLGLNKDENIGAINHIIDSTDSQPGYSAP